MPTSFAIPANNIFAIVGTAGYTAGSTVLTVAAGQGAQFPALSANQFYRITVVRQAKAYDPTASPATDLTVFRATSLTTDTFHGVVAIDGTTDRNYVAGDVVDVRVSAGTIGDLQTAVNVLENTDRFVCQGRLTYVSGKPTADGSGTILYFTPYNGNQVSLYDGTVGWNVLTFTEKSLTVPATTGTYDVFAYNNAGTLAIEFSTVWTVPGNPAADGVRANALATQDGVLVKAGATTRRYLGTLYSLSGTGKDILQNRWLWNNSNRIQKKMFVAETTGNWSYATGTWRPMNNNVNGLSYLQVVCGQSIEYAELFQTIPISTTASQYGYVGFAYDSITVVTLDCIALTQSPSIATVSNRFAMVPHLGLHTFYAMEMASGATATFYGGSYQAYTGFFWC